MIYFYSHLFFFSRSPVVLLDEKSYRDHHSKSPVCFKCKNPIKLHVLFFSFFCLSLQFSKSHPLNSNQQQQLINKQPSSFTHISEYFSFVSILFTAPYCSAATICLWTLVYTRWNNGMYTPARRLWLLPSFQRNLPPSAMPLYSSCHCDLLSLIWRSSSAI